MVAIDTVDMHITQRVEFLSELYRVIEWLTGAMLLM